MNNKPLIVQCDFDGTLIVNKASSGIKEEFGTEGWRSLEADYRAGKYSVEESNVRQFALLRASEYDIENYVNRELVVRDGLREFVAHCEELGIRFVIVSCGLDAYIRPTLKKYNIDYLETHSGQTEFYSSCGVNVKYFDPNGILITNGFKESFVRYFKSEGHIVVYMGDGMSDVAPAREADYVFARSTLRMKLAEHGIPHYEFETFNDVNDRIDSIMNEVKAKS